MSVETLNWPAEDDRRRALAQRSVPRLLLLEADQPPPVVTDPLEDWIRRPYSQADLDARLTSLGARFTGSVDNLDPLIIDDDGVLRTEQGWLALSDVEVKLMSELVGRYGTVVDRDSLQNAAWPNQQVSRNLLDVYLHKLRPRVTAVGLEINTVRKRGYLLDRVNHQAPTPTHTSEVATRALGMARSTAQPNQPLRNS